MRRAILLLSLAVFFLALAPARAEACTCRPSGPPCEAAYQAALVFSGKVAAIVPLDPSRPNPEWGPRRIRFEIREAFRGTDAREVELYSHGGGSAACDFDFRVGEEYLVYAHPRGDAPGWMTSRCSRTRPLREAAEDLRYLRTPDEQKPPSHIAGRVTRYVYDLSPAKPGESVPIEGVPVTVTRGRTRLESKTDSAGRYLINVDPGDAYQVDFGRVEGLTIRGSQQVSVPHPRACAIADAGVAYDGRVSGQIVDGLGLPVPFLPITLVSSPRYLQRHTLTDVAGRFQFDVVYPGPHIVTPATDLWQGARSFAPLTPAPLTVPAAGDVDAGQLRIPSSMKLTLVEILMEDSAGNPASGAYVTFKQPDVYNAISYAPQPRADERGAFRVSLVAGQRYEVGAAYTGKTPAEAVYEEATVVISATGMKPIRIRLAPFR